MFELLAPVFAVAGGLLAGVPIILHMFRRSPAIRIPFSIVRFLTPTLPKTTKRASIEHWPLMLLRILAVALIALAFARPFQRLTVARAAEADSSRRIAILVDCSASMRRDGLRESVIREIENVVSELRDEDVFSISAFSRTTRSLLTAAVWRQTEPGGRAALIASAIEACEADWLATNTAAAMLEVADEVSRDQGSSTGQTERRMILITDFQEGSRLDELRSGTWPESVKLELRMVSPASQGNAGLSLSDETQSGKIRVRVTNSGDAQITRYTLSPFDLSGAPAGPPQTVDVGSGQRRTVVIPETGPDKPPVAGVELLNEPHSFDNVVDLPLAKRGSLKVGHAGTTDENDPDSMRYYLQRALDGNEVTPVDLVDLKGADGLAIPVPDDVQLVFVTDTVPEGLTRSIRELLDRGGMVLITLKSTEMAASLSTFLPENTEISEAVVKDYAIIGQLDFTSDVLTPFAEARFADFSSIKFWHYRRLTFDEKSPGAPRVLARFDSGAPAIIEISQPSGGRLLILAAGWQPADSQWALSTRFPPMVHRVVQLANPRQAGHLILETGHRINPAELSGSQQWGLTLPDGSVRTPSDKIPSEKTSSKETSGDNTAGETTAAGEQSAPASSTAPSILLDTPGRWQLNWESAEGLSSKTLLVNVPSSESRTEPLPAGQLQALGMSPSTALVRTTTEDKISPSQAAQLDATELESQQKFWRWLLLSGLGCLALEGIVSFLIEHRTHAEAVK